MAKKKKKETDFQKPKLKVGRRLLRGTNDTKTDFKSKKIILKEMESRSKDPIKALANSVGINSQIKLLCLNSVDQWLNSTNVNHKSGEVVNTVSKYLIDCDKRVRSDCIKCLKHCIGLLHKNKDNKSVAPLMPIVLTYVNCALTHIDTTIGVDSLKLLSFLIDFCDNSLYNQLMQTISTRIANKSNIDWTEFEICCKFVSLMHRNDKNWTVLGPKEPSVMKWSADNCYCDLNSLDYGHCPSFEVNLSFQTNSSVDIKEKFFKTLETIVRKELNIFLSKPSNHSNNSNHLSFSVTEARKCIFALKISSIIGLKFKTNNEIPEINITSINANKKSSRQQQQLISHLNNELSSSITTFFNHNSN